MKILNVEVKEVNADHVTLDGKLVMWGVEPDYKFFEPIGWTPEDQYADVEEVMQYWLEAKNSPF